jgi:uncharacterized repeat protein (TIGR03833 family)
MPYGNYIRLRVPCTFLPLLRIIYITGTGVKSDSSMDGTRRINIHIGDNVDIVLKQDQRTSKLTRGTVSEILTSSQSHPHGIKVRLTDGKVGRVKSVNPP